MTHAWHEFPEPRPGSGGALAAAVALGVVFGLAILAGVVLAQRARGGASTVRHAWFANAAAATAGLVFGALARFGPVGAPA